MNSGRRFGLAGATFGGKIFKEGLIQQYCQAQKEIFRGEGGEKCLPIAMS